MRTWFLLVALAVSMSAAVAAENVAAPRTVLLLSESTRFKDALIANMQTLLREQGIEVTVGTHSRRGMDTYKAAAFDAVFITNSGVNSRVRPWVSAWLDGSQAEAARILLHTTQTLDWKVNTHVDAVTSASSMADVDALAKRYTARLLELMAPADGAGDL